MKNFIKKWHKEILIVLYAAFFCLEILIMKEAVVFPKVLGFGAIGIRTYGVVITIAVFLITFVVGKEFKKFKELQKIEISDVLLYALVPGIIGARLYHVITDWDLYTNNLVGVFYVWNGGLGIYGAVIGGILGLWLYSRKRNFKLPVLLDLIVVFLPLAQVIGRMGNLVNQEIIGLPTDLPWSWQITLLNGTFHPVFLYEQIGNTILFVILLWAYKNKKFIIGSGKFLLTYTIGYSLVRFVVEFFRLEERVLLDVFSVNQIVSFCIILIAIVWLLVNKRHGTHKPK